MRDNLADEAAPALAFPRAENVHGQAQRDFHVLKSDSAKHGATLGCKACSFVSRGAKSSVRHSDECMQEIMEEVEADDEGTMRRFLDKNALRCPAPEVAGRGGAAQAVAASAVRAVGGASNSSSAGGAPCSPMEAENEEVT